MSKIKIVIRVDGSRELGLGHIMRTLVVADAVKVKAADLHLDPSITFVSKNYEGARISFDNSRYGENVRWIDTDSDENEAFKSILNEIKPDVVVTDIDLRGKVEEYLNAISPSIHVSLHEHNFPILSGDRVVAPTIHPVEPERSLTPGYSCFTGAEFVILPLEIADLRDSALSPSLVVKTVTISLGGSDPLRLTEMVLQAIRACNSPRIDWQVILGPASGYDADILMGLYPANVKYYYGRELSRWNFLKLLAESDLAVTNAGTTVYEALALGRPVLSIPQNDFEKEVAAILSNEGAVVTPETVDKVDVLKCLADIVGDKRTRETIAKKGSQLIDGQGAFRVADIILENVI